MVRLPRSIARLLGRGAGRTPPAPEASEWLRRSVLTTVRGEDLRAGDSSPAAHPRDRYVYTGVGALMGAGAVLVVVLALGNRDSPRRHEPAAPVARASLRRIGTRAELVISDMPQPPIGEVYELWLDRAGRAPEAADALFTVTSSGSAAVEVPGGLRGVGDVIVTTEPLGGSTRPTSLPVLRVPAPRGS